MHSVFNIVYITNSDLCKEQKCTHSSMWIRSDCKSYLFIMVVSLFLIISHPQILQAYDICLADLSLMKISTFISSMIFYNFCKAFWLGSWNNSNIIIDLVRCLWCFKVCHCFMDCRWLRKLGLGPTSTTGIRWHEDEEEAKGEVPYSPKIIVFVVIFMCAMLLGLYFLYDYLSMYFSKWWSLCHWYIYSVVQSQS